MKKELIQRVFTLPSLVALLLTIWLSIATAVAQDQPKPEKNIPETPQAPSQTEKSQSSQPTSSPDIEIKANVTAKELKFEVVGNATVEFTGNVKRDTFSNADRQNLPNPVKPGVTYKDIGIKLVITSLFADIERIVSDALKEKSVRQDETQKQNESSKPPSPTGDQPKSPGGGKRL